MIAYAIRAILLAALVLVAFLQTTPLAAETVTLRMSSWVPPMHHLHQTFTEWTAQVERASGGDLKIVLDGAPLAKPQGQYELASKGRADLVFPVLGYMPSRFALTRGMELPFLSPSAEVGSRALWDWYTRNVAGKEFNDVKLITLFVHGPGILHSKTQVMSLEDLAGMKLRVGGGGVAIARALGAVPVAMTANEAHHALLRGTTQGTLFPWEAIASYRLTGLVRHHLEIPGGLYTTVFAVVMNKAKYESLSSKQKAVLNRFGGAYGAAFIGRHWDEADREARKEAEVNGEYIHTLSAHELERWRDKISFLEEDWVSRMNDRGLDGEKLLTALREAVAESQKYVNGHADLRLSADRPAAAAAQ